MLGVSAQTTPSPDAPKFNKLLSTTWVFGPIGCTGTDLWFNPETYSTFRQLPPKIWVVGASIFLDVGNAMLGHTDPNGDLVGPMTNSSPAITWFPAGTAFHHTKGVDEFHIHYTCPREADGKGWMYVQLFYTIDDTP